MALGITSQLSSSITSIDMSGFKFGTGDNALLLGTNVIGTIVAWGLMAITLLENPFGAQLTQESTQGNNFWQAAKQAPFRKRTDQVTGQQPKSTEMSHVKGEGAQPV